MTATSEPRRLTEMATQAGCTAKAGADAVEQILRHLAASRSIDAVGAPAALLVGLREPDDAAVYRLDAERALVLTVDFFAPLVDDPYAYGAIAAANALSDIYAMGGDVALALNISAFPAEMEEEVIAEILRGGAEKVEEAGGVIAGGHTIIDAEPKYGLCVMGFVHPERILTKRGAQPGDRLYLTKPLGSGMITTAAKFREVTAEHLEAATAYMAQLNRSAAEVVREIPARAATDITGFGILGHSYEIAAASGVALQIEASALPLLPGALEYAYRGIVTGGGFRNRNHLNGKVRIAEAVTADFAHVLYDPQTSGGLLFAVDAAETDRVEERFEQADLALWQIGEVTDGDGVIVRP